MRVPEGALTLLEYMHLQLTGIGDVGVSVLADACAKGALTKGAAGGKLATQNQKKIKSTMFRRSQQRGKLLRKRDDVNTVATLTRDVQASDTTAEPAAGLSSSDVPVVASPCTDDADEGLLDTRLAPQSTNNHFMLRRSNQLPKFLRVSGNAKAWDALATAIRSAQNRVVLLYGPTGCGKTRGVYDLSRNCLGMTVSEFNAMSACSTADFVRRIRGVTGSRTLLGERIALVDDVDGFDESYISALIGILKSRAENEGPIVITCTNPFDKSLMGFRPLNLTQVRLYAPTLAQMCDAARSVRSDVTASVTSHHAELANGNFHQLFLRLRTYMHSTPDEHVGLFTTTQALLTQTTNVDAWMRSAEPVVLRMILYENFTALRTADSNNDWVAFAELLSETDALTDEAALTLLGMGAQKFLHTNDPPALRLLKRPKPQPSRGIAHDIPALLRAL